MRKFTLLRKMAYTMAYYNGVNHVQSSSYRKAKVLMNITEHKRIYNNEFLTSCINFNRSTYYGGKWPYLKFQSHLYLCAWKINYLFFALVKETFPLSTLYGIKPCYC